MTVAEKRQLQRDFFRKAGPNVETLRAAFDTLRDTGFYITDDRDRLIAFTRRNCEEVNVIDETAIIGKTCADLYPPVLAEVYMARDRQVRETGVPIVNQAYTHSGDRSTDIRIVSVFPVRSARGKVVGTFCIYRSVSCGDALPDWYGRIRSVVAHIDAHYAERLVIADLAAIARMSVSTFCRVFAATMQTTPAKYLTTIRLNAARRLLTATDMLVSDVAHATGFCDQSHFIKSFKVERGLTPNQYRRHHWAADISTAAHRP